MKNTNEPIGFGIVGTGSVADKHAQALLDAGGAELRAVQNRTREKAEKLAQEHSVEVEPTFESLLQRSDIDVVCVTTPTGTHAQLVIPALQAGKHVLCEKPLDINLSRIDAMIEAAQSNERILACIFQSRFGTGVRKTRDALEKGRFGQLTLCNVNTRSWRSQEYYDQGGWRGTWELDGGGALMNQGIHGVDLLQWLVGMPSEVHAFAATLAHQRIETEDTLLANLRFPHGALGNIECATSAYPGFARTIEISGDTGSVFLKDDRIVHWEFAEPLPEDESIRNSSSEEDMKSGASDPMAISTRGHQLQIEDMVRAIRNHSEVAIPGHEGRNAVALIEAIYRSAKSGETVTVEQ